MNAPFRQPDTAARTATLHLFAFFHLNLAFSSIEEGQRAEVIKRCYRPVLDLAAAHGALDLVISAPTAAAASAAAVGTEVRFLTAGRTWPQLGTDAYPWYRETHVFSPAKFGDWKAVMPQISDALTQLRSSRAHR